MTPENRVRLMTMIEDAIHIAADLGKDAFDYVEGRGLYHLRQEIQKIIRREE